MRQWFTKHPRGALGTGIAIGLLVGAGMVVGSWATMTFFSSPQYMFPATALHATATDSGETFAMATGAVAEGVEGVFFLDFLTGELRCWVMNSRTGQMGGFFGRNVIGDLEVEQGRKNPRFLMVTGLAIMQRATSGYRSADSLVYVADASTGNFAVYAIPWNRQAVAANMPQQAPMALIYKGSARNLEIRGQ